MLTKISLISVLDFSLALASFVLSLLLWVLYQSFLIFVAIVRYNLNESRSLISFQTIDLSMPALFTQLSEIYQVAFASTMPVWAQKIVREPNQIPGKKQKGICCSIQKIISPLCKPIVNTVYIGSSAVQIVYIFNNIVLNKNTFFSILASSLIQ